MELNHYVMNHMEFLDVILEHTDPKFQTNKNIQICLVILNKILGNDRDLNPEELPVLDYVRQSPKLNNLRELCYSPSVDDVTSNFAEAILDEFFQSND